MTAKNGLHPWRETGRLLVATLAGLALAVIGFDAVAGIANTKHNLVSSDVANNRFTPTSGTAEICVFCHTPHAAATGATVPPLWNKALPASGSYTLYDTNVSSTIDGESIAVGSVSIACLSCHDGSQAMNNMINAPGSGNYNAAGANLSGTWLAGTGTASPVDPVTGQLAARTATSGVGNIGVDLRDDHPIGIQYCGGGPTVTAPGAACRDGDFVAPQNTTISGNVVFWVDTGGAGRQKTDMILYNRAFAVAGNAPAVECASCHDPHSETNPTFLRISNASSAVCLACHVK